MIEYAFNHPSSMHLILQLLSLGTKMWRADDELYVLGMAHLLTMPHELLAGGAWCLGNPSSPHCIMYSLPVSLSAAHVLAAHFHGRSI